MSDSYIRILYPKVSRKLLAYLPTVFRNRNRPRIPPPSGADPAAAPRVLGLACGAPMGGKGGESSTGRACRAPWSHVASRLGEDRDELEQSMREVIVRTMGFDDQVVFDMLMRHLSRCFAAEDLQLDELGWLFGVLADAEQVGAMIDTLVQFVDAGLEESWYEAQLQRRYQCATARDRARPATSAAANTSCSSQRDR